MADDFIAKAKKIQTLKDLNHYWEIFLEEYYHNRAHEGIREYYESIGTTVPKEGISPLQEFNRDTRPLTFLDTTVVGEAFRHHEIRKVDKGGCISFQGRKYETKTQLIGRNVEISYDPAEPQIITVSHEGIEPFQAEPLQIQDYCNASQILPDHMQETIPETSRFLLNYRFDSVSPMALILVGQTELWEDKLRLKRYDAVRQRIDINCVLPHLDRTETERYIKSHLKYAGVGERELFSRRAMDEIFRISSGIPRLVNRICEKALMYGYQQGLRIIDDQDVLYVSDHEMLNGGEQL